MRTLVIAVIVSAAIAIGLQMVLPFPFGVIFAIAIPAIIIWRAIKATDTSQFSLVNYRRVDPKDEKEKKQNREAYRILKKKYLEEKITKEEFDRLKKEFGDEIED